MNKGWFKKGHKLAQTHGHANHGDWSPTYTTWFSMKSRCLHKKEYAHVEVCDRWKNSFENFLEDMGERPEGKTIDRIEGSKGYELSNCRWATHREQCLNRKSTRFIEHMGMKKTIADWARFSGVNQYTLSSRLRAGWPIERAIA